MKGVCQYIVYAELLLISALCLASAKDDWKPTNLNHCRTNNDCNSEHLCCSITPALGKRLTHERQLPPNWDGTVHYCLPWKNENATWCSLNLQYSSSADNYQGLCPCGPGLVCAPTNELDAKHYPRDRYGKCITIA